MTKHFWLKNKLKKKRFFATLLNICDVYTKSFAIQSINGNNDWILSKLFS